MGALDGVRVVVTRAAHQAEELARPLRERGAQVILLPLIGIVPPADPEPLRRAAAQCNRYEWILFTSANAVHAFARELPQSAEKCRARIAVIGAATRQAAEDEGFAVALMPEKYVAESLVAAFGAEDLSDDGLRDRRVLIPSAAVTRDVVATELRRRGALVDVVEAYRNVLPPEAASSAAKIFDEPYPDWVTFASSSAVDHLVSLVGVDVLRGVKLASIGPITSETIRKHGLTVAAEASVPTMLGLAEVCEI